MLIISSGGSSGQREPEHADVKTALRLDRAQSFGAGADPEKGWAVVET